MNKLIQRVRQALTGRVVHVWWEGEFYSHRAASFRDAIQWMRAYPADAAVVIRGRFGGLEAMRG
ncbi:hypothetical protein KMB83_gp07 [Ralstonia phage Anchaing]|uniref:Uncharacterized protein n=1 Tax=Ralstonia phage Anchaing TaxID=2759719 RepID=A0A7G5B8A4_9CAUD|nr:hypothetical protein KMB83_gp07 [Ralstonia phage Anchaing]QMV32527.1 hypothetical protein A1_00007 [Ralstonia phage Anchaing]